MEGRIVKTEIGNFRIEGNTAVNVDDPDLKLRVPENATDEEINKLMKELSRLFLG